MSLVSEIGTRLSSQAVGGLTSSATWRIMYRELAAGLQGSSSQDKMIAIIPTGGFNAYSAEGSTHLTRPSFQIIVRDTHDSSTGLEAKVASVISALHLYKGTLGGYKYLDIELQGEPAYLGRDTNDRPAYSINFVAFRSRTT